MGHCQGLPQCFWCRVALTNSASGFAEDWQSFQLPSADAHGWQVGVSLDVSLCVAAPFCCAMAPIPSPSHLGHRHTQTRGAGTASDEGIGLSGFHHARLAHPGDKKVRSLDLCASRISQDVCHEQYRFGPCSWLRVARMFFVLYANVMIGLVGFSMALVFRET